MQTLCEQGTQENFPFDEKQNTQYRSRSSEKLIERSRQRRWNTRGWQSMCFGNEYKKFALLLSTVRIARRFSTEHSWFRGYFVHTKKDMGNVNQKWEIIVLKADECSLKCYKCMSPAPIANNLKRLSHWTTYWWIHNWINNWAIFLEFLLNISHPPAHYWWRIRRNQSM